MQMRGRRRRMDLIDTYDRPFGLLTNGANHVAGSMSVTAAWRPRLLPDRNWKSYRQRTVIWARQSSIGSLPAVRVRLVGHACKRGKAEPMSFFYAGELLRAALKQLRRVPMPDFPDKRLPIHHTPLQSHCTAPDYHVVALIEVGLAAHVTTRVFLR
jgi:hypothetical protein